MIKVITQEELATLEKCQSEAEWNEACDAIKKARDGRYPPDWWTVVNTSGMMARIARRWS